MRVEALAVSLWAAPGARQVGVPVVVAVRNFAAIAITGGPGQAGGTNSGIAEWLLECVGDSFGLFGFDRVAESVVGGDPLDKEMPLRGVAVPEIDSLKAFLPGGPLAGQVAGSDEFAPGGGSAAHRARRLNYHALHHAKDPSRDTGWGSQSSIWQHEWSSSGSLSSRKPAQTWGWPPIS